MSKTNLVGKIVSKLLLALCGGGTALFIFFIGAELALAVCPYTATEVQCSANENLSTGAKCQRVCDLQEALYRLDYYNEQPDGQYGSITAEAVRKYQSEHDLKGIDGIAGRETLTSLGLAAPAATSDTGAGAGAGGNPGGVNATTFSCAANEERVGSLCVPKSDSGGIAGVKTIKDLILIVVNTLLGFAGVIAIIFIIIGGFWYMTAQGNDEQAEKGKKALINAIIGLVIVIMAYAVVSVVTRTLTTNSQVGSSTDTQTVQ